LSNACEKGSRRGKPHNQSEVPVVFKNLAHWHGVDWSPEKNSYAGLAGWINTEITAVLEAFFAMRSQETARGHTIDIDALLAPPSWCIPSGYPAEDLKFAIWIMEAMGLSRKGIRDWCMETLGNLRNGLSAFRWGGPINRKRIIDKLKRFVAFLNIHPGNTQVSLSNSLAHV
jgi:hypothetical protein